MNTPIIDDPLRDHLDSLFSGLGELTKGTLVAGGYGLFLKLCHLLHHSETTTVLALSDWLDRSPRATNDMDLVISLEIIADEEKNSTFASVLEREGYLVGNKESDKRWKFLKETEEGKRVIVELHSPAPDNKSKGLKNSGFTVKHVPSLGIDGIHGRTNPEAIGSHLHPFRIRLSESNIGVPNPITWSIMKITAAADMWGEYLTSEKDYKEKGFIRSRLSNMEMIYAA